MTGVGLAANPPSCSASTAREAKPHSNRLLGLDVKNWRASRAVGGGGAPGTVPGLPGGGECPVARGASGGCMCCCEAACRAGDPSGQQCPEAAGALDTARESHSQLIEVAEPSELILGAGHAGVDKLARLDG